MLVPAPVFWFGSLPGAVLSGSAQKVPKDAAWRGVELIAPAIKATPPRPPQARTFVFAVLHFLLLGGLQLKQLPSFQEQGIDRFLKYNTSIKRNLFLYRTMQSINVVIQ